MDQKKRKAILDYAESWYLEHKEADSSIRSADALDESLRKEGLEESLPGKEYAGLWEALDERLKEKPRPDLVTRAAKWALKRMENDKSIGAEDGLVWVLEELDSDMGLTKEQYDAYVWAIQQKIYDAVGTMEQLPLAVLMKANNDFTACESDWNPITEDVAEKFINCDLEVAKMMGKDTSDVMTWENAKPLLEAGKAVTCGIGVIRKRTDAPKCPRCGSSIIGMGALSRIDNQTKLCSDCGNVEALEDFFHIVQA